MLSEGQGSKLRLLLQELLLRKIWEDLVFRMNLLPIVNSRKMLWGDPGFKPRLLRRMLIWGDLEWKKKIITLYFREKRLWEDANNKELMFYSKPIKEQEKGGVSLKLK
jgi:hypothetical protein